MSDELKPLTEAELGELERMALAGKRGDETALDELWFDDLLRLVAEIRILRKAATE